jgi:hypothetical protein
MKSPKFVALEITSRCQLRCKGCFSSPEDYPKGDMDFDFYKSVLDRMSVMSPKSWLNPYANGEPLLHPRVTEMVEYAISKKLKNYITTNGMIYNAELFTLMLSNPDLCYQLIFSLDGLWDGASRSIELARPGSNRDRIQNTIFRVLELKQKLNSKTDIMVKICERGQDWEEIENFISYWLQVPGISAVIKGKLFTEFETEGMRLYPCQYSDDQFMLIRWDKTAVVCMYNPKVMNHGMLPIGKLDTETPLLDFYNNSAYSSFREAQKKRAFPEPCKTCGIAYTGSGRKGVMRFRNPSLFQQDIFFRGDHYNEFYSLEEKAKPDSTYGYKEDSGS